MAEKISPEAVEAEELAAEAAAPADVRKGLIEVLDGDTYRSIAERVGKVTAEQLHALNNENPLYPGMKVRIK